MVSTTLFIRPVTALGVAIFVMVATQRGAAELLDGSIQCALTDLRVLTLIESHGESEDISADKLSHAYVTMLKARAACATGHVDEALEIYDSIVVAFARAAGK